MTAQGLVNLPAKLFNVKSFRGEHLRLPIWSLNSVWLRRFASLSQESKNAFRFIRAADFIGCLKSYLDGTFGAHLSPTVTSELTIGHARFGRKFTNDSLKVSAL